MLTAADREIRLGIWKTHILHHADSREVCGTWLLSVLLNLAHVMTAGVRVLATSSQPSWPSDSSSSGGAAVARGHRKRYGC